MRQAGPVLHIALTFANKKLIDTTPRNFTATASFFILLAVLVSGTIRVASAHEAGAPFSGAMIEPLILHHAHLEDEQRLNLFSSRKLRESETPRRRAFEAELELA